MLKHLALFLFLATICINCANATGTCSATENNCESGEWCKTQTDADNTTTYVCFGCTNLPDVSGAQYTGSGTTATNCPWELTCSNGTVFVPDETEKSGACKTCNDKMNDPYYHYVCSLGTDGSYVVKWDGTNFSYHTTIPTELLDNDGQPIYSSKNPATCVGRPYEVNINCNGGTGCPTEVYRQYGNETDWWKTRDINDDNQKITKILPIPTKKRHEFKGYYLDPDNDNTQIFDKNGQLKSAVSALVTGIATLYAKWVVGGTYTITIQDNCGDAATFPAKNCQFGQDCALNFPCSNTRYGGNVLQWSIPDNCGTISSDSQTFYLSDTCNIDKGDDLQITLTCTSCPANSYCNSCQQYPCPQHTISNAGSVTRTDCKFDPNTQFNDSVGSFTLPAGSNITIKWDL